MTSTPRRHFVRSLLGAGLLPSLLIACASPTGGQGAPVLSSERITQIIASPERSAADRTNDLRRKPE
jgi:predicted methyltransferase